MNPTLRHPSQPAAADKAQQQARAARKRLIVSVIIGSIAVHILALVIFGIYVVAQYFEEPEATFEVRKKLTIPAETPEHRMNLAQHEAMAPQPTLTERLVSSRPSAFSLPKLPRVPVDQMMPINASDFVSDSVSSLLGASGSGNGLGSGTKGSGGQGSGVGFFGINDRARSVVIMIDISDSMFGRTGDLDYKTRKLMRQGKEQSFQRIREEAFKLIDGLSIDSRFGIIAWSGSARAWQAELVRATDANKAAAREHIQLNIDYRKAPPWKGKPGGTRHDYALEELLRLNPEVAFMLTDGNATRSLGGGRMEEIPEKDLLNILAVGKDEGGSIPRIHTIYYVTGNEKREEERMLRAIQRRSGGKFRSVKVKKRRD